MTHAPAILLQIEEALGLLLLLLALTYEVLAWLTHQPTLTVVVRTAIDSHPRGSTLIALGTGLVLGHLLWPAR
jgi:hypothetical protein